MSPSRKIGPRRIRGRTAAGRMRLLDAFLIHAAGRYLCPDPFTGAFDGPFVDVGFGEEPVTTLETAALLRDACAARGGGPLMVVGVETDGARVARAEELAGELTRFLHVEFAIAEKLDRPARLVRAMNVLRQYAPEEVEVAHRIWGEALAEGACLVEGTCDGDGAVLTAHVLQRRGEGAERLGLLFATDFSRGFSPWLFRDRLPADLRRSVRSGHPVWTFLESWERHAAAAREEGARAPAATFRVAGRAFARADEAVICDDVMAQSGLLFWSVTRADLDRRDRRS